MLNEQASVKYTHYPPPFPSPLLSSPAPNYLASANQDAGRFKAAAERFHTRTPFDDPISSANSAPLSGHAHFHPS